MKRTKLRQVVLSCSGEKVPSFLVVDIRHFSGSFSGDGFVTDSDIVQEILMSGFLHRIFER